MSSASPPTWPASPHLARFAAACRAEDLRALADLDDPWTTPAPTTPAGALG